MSSIIYKKRFKEEESEEGKSAKAIADLISLDWEKDENAQHTALALLKALVLADTKNADAFLQDLSNYSSNMDKEKYK